MTSPKITTTKKTSAALTASLAMPSTLLLLLLLLDVKKSFHLEASQTHIVHTAINRRRGMKHLGQLFVACRWEKEEEKRDSVVMQLLHAWPRKKKRGQFYSVSLSGIKIVGYVRSRDEDSCWRAKN